MCMWMWDACGTGASGTVRGGTARFGKPLNKALRKTQDNPGCPSAANMAGFIV